MIFFNCQIALFRDFYQKQVVEIKIPIAYSITMQELTKEHVLKIMENYGNDPQQLIAVLLDIQAASGSNHVEQKWAALTSTVLNVPLSKIYDVLTFYAMFNIEKRGEYIIEICRSTPCYFGNGDDATNDDKASKTAVVVQWFEAASSIKMGETSADGKISLFYTSCVGACDIGPVAKIGDDVFGNLTETKVKELVELCRSGNSEGLSKLCQN